MPIHGYSLVSIGATGTMVGVADPNAVRSCDAVTVAATAISATSSRAGATLRPTDQLYCITSILLRVVPSGG